jgi:hypothetical protein
MPDADAGSAAESHRTACICRLNKGPELQPRLCSRPRSQALQGDYLMGALLAASHCIELAPRANPCWSVATAAPAPPSPPCYLHLVTCRGVKPHQSGMHGSCRHKGQMPAVLLAVVDGFGPPLEQVTRNEGNSALLWVLQERQDKHADREVHLSACRWFTQLIIRRRFPMPTCSPTSNLQCFNFPAAPTFRLQCMHVQSLLVHVEIADVLSLGSYPQRLSLSLSCPPSSFSFVGRPLSAPFFFDLPFSLEMGAALPTPLAFNQVDAPELRFVRGALSPSPPGKQH